MAPLDALTLRLPRVLLLAGLLFCAACPPEGSSEEEPAGTTSDPVEVCERAGDVCELDDARLGVCVQPHDTPPPASCQGRDPCYVCQPQH